MDLHELKEDVKAYAKEIGIDKIRFTTPDVFTELKERLRTQQNLGYQSGFEKGTIEERTEPNRIVPEAKSIISIALAYPSKLKDAPRSTREDRRGLFCRASWGQDYHDVLRDRLTKLGEYLESRVTDFYGRSMVDTGELSDRAVAERAGIGFTGKNTNLITEEYGSYVYLGELLTNVAFPPDEPVDDSCGDCNICVDACPTGALIEGGQLNAQKCIAFLTQTKGFLPDEYRSVIGNRLYGCDTCQTVCPKNKKKHNLIHAEFQPDPERVKPSLKPLLSISNREFKETYGQMSGSWRGKKPIQRNAILALAHYKDETAIEELTRLMNQDPRPVIRGTAAWALGKIGNPSAYTAITEAKGKETDEEVIEEMDKGLALL
ncbi:MULTISPECIES: tRNA epoxyqueuosine(34) reductase QueG [Pontibacillus]|uniref:Epoxyqueuosine reductase n=1 Tax=Pontibacillus chungwhensis TaxID=265426 RepID=A0ABY8UYY2_9BACI|nr:MULTISPECIES: tRNA epoxyqueuosine(34) reductase QueG [Pontibacillus]MCD5324730.1 tRNA epoxyqueuosine(34) reductase QueG [Pontibacillus sp. HN14]WIF98689.1 tRNA epoxyqueuosine(34) reductase QueG [Pontibacillus chungwhensis]